VLVTRKLDARKASVIPGRHGNVRDDWKRRASATHSIAWNMPAHLE
jgi:hypothetical protein